MPRLLSVRQPFWSTGLLWINGSLRAAASSGNARARQEATATLLTQLGGELSLSQSLLLSAGQKARQVVHAWSWTLKHPLLLRTGRP